MFLVDRVEFGLIIYFVVYLFSGYVWEVVFYVCGLGIRVGE